MIFIGTEAAQVVLVEKPGDTPISRPDDRINLLIVGLAFVALIAKLAIAYNTVGTNDTVFFYGFAKVLSEHSLEWTYQHSAYFNHPPLTAYYLRGIYWLTEQSRCQQLGLHFPFLLRLPGIVADFVVVLVLLRISQQRLGVRIPTWALCLFTLSPVSLMVSGFHGNTDPVVVVFLVCAAAMCLCERPVLCGLFFALSCQIKIIPLILLPIVLFFWLSHRQMTRFTASFALICAVMWAEPLFHFPLLFLRNVFAYGSYWGVWGITYCLRLSHLRPFNGTGAFNLPFAPMAIAFLLKVLIIATVLLLGWRRRHLSGRAALDSIAYGWIVLFVLSPGICVQYMVWLAPFILILSAPFYGWLTATSSLFLFFFYNATAGGLPWYVAISSDDPEKLNLWVPWSLWPWITLLIGMVLFSKRAIAIDLSPRISSFKILREETA